MYYKSLNKEKKNSIKEEKHDPGGDRTHDLLLRRQLRFHCATGSTKKIKKKSIIKKGKASAGIEPTTFPLLGERTADYAKRPYV